MCELYRVTENVFKEFSIRRPQCIIHKIFKLFKIWKTGKVHRGIFKKFYRFFQRKTILFFRKSQWLWLIGNRTSCRPIVCNHTNDWQIGLLFHRRLIFIGIGLHSVLLPLLIITLTTSSNVIGALAGLWLFCRVFFRLCLYRRYFLE